MRIVANMFGLGAIWLFFAWVVAFLRPLEALPKTFDFKTLVTLGAAVLLAAGPYSFIAKFEGLLKDARIPSRSLRIAELVRYRRISMLWALVAYPPIAGLVTFLLWEFGEKERAISALAGSLPVIVFGATRVIAFSLELSKWDSDLAKIDAKSRAVVQRKSDAEKLRVKQPESADAH